MRVIRAMLDLETGCCECLAALQREGGEWSVIASVPEPENARSPAWREGTKAIQDDMEMLCPIDNRLYCVKGSRCSLFFNHTEEVHRQMQRLGTRPPNAVNAFAEPDLECLRRAQPWLSERDREKAPHRRLRYRYDACERRPPAGPYRRSAALHRSSSTRSPLQLTVCPSRRP